jgi:hypothetical protein
LNFVNRFSKKYKYQISSKIHPVGVGLFHADKDERTDMTKLIVAFLNFANAPKKGKAIHVQALGVPGG